MSKVAAYIECDELYPFYRMAVPKGGDDVYYLEEVEYKFVKEAMDNFRKAQAILDREFEKRNPSC